MNGFLSCFKLSSGSGGKGTVSMPFLQVLFPPPSLDLPAGHSPGGRVPLGFTLNQDVVTGIHNVVLH